MRATGKWVEEKRKRERERLEEQRLAAEAYAASLPPPPPPGVERDSWVIPVRYLQPYHIGPIEPWHRPDKAVTYVAKGKVAESQAKRYVKRVDHAYWHVFDVEEKNIYDALRNDVPMDFKYKHHYSTYRVLNAKKRDVMRVYTSKYQMRRMNPAHKKPLFIFILNDGGLFYLPVSVFVQYNKIEL